MYLLDTHVLLWWLSDNPLLDPKHRAILEDKQSLIWLSAVSVWEISIKTKLGKLSIPDSFFEVLEEQGFIELAITHEHARAIQSLPKLHSDPFDRLLIAQAQTEGITILTSDNAIKKYEASCQ